MEAFENALRCGLCQKIMTDPVVVTTEFNPSLRKGVSYQRDVLEKFLADKSDTQTRFGENQNLHKLIHLYFQMI